MNLWETVLYKRWVLKSSTVYLFLSWMGHQFICKLFKAELGLEKLGIQQLRGKNSKNAAILLFLLHNRYRPDLPLLGILIYNTTYRFTVTKHTLHCIVRFRYLQCVPLWRDHPWCCCDLFSESSQTQWCHYSDRHFIKRQNRQIC